ncbi:MAG: cyanophycin synthetase [bacterium]|nr:cyanophycin synthetase [bacterium]
MTKTNFLASSLIAEIAPELGLEVHIEPEYGYVGQIKTKDGRLFYFRNTSFDLNGQGSSDNAKDKGYAAYFMKRFGYSVPESEEFYSDRWAEIIKSNKTVNQACVFAQKLGYPVIVKPNSKSQGAGVEKVHTDEHLTIALNYVFDEIKDRVGIVQRFIEGDDYRIVTLDMEIVAAYRRTPLSVTGDGVNSILQLLRYKQKMFSEMGRDTTIKPDDPRILRKLIHSGLNFDAIIESGLNVRLLDNANLSTGGDAEDVTDSIHESYKSMAIQLTHDMGLRYCGVDIITSQPINKPLNNYCVIEINAAPGLDYYVNGGDKQRNTVREMYKKVLVAMTQMKDL